MATIHINPENKGKFNATKKATGKTTEELTHSKNPVTKKRAIFAQNASRWNKKELGGEIDVQDYLSNPDQYGFGSWLKDNAGTVGSVVGAGLGTLIAPGVGTAIGAQLGSTIGGSVQQNDQQKDQDDLLQKQQLTQLAMNRMANGGYVANFGNSVGSQLLAPIAGSIQKDQTQSEYDELGQKKVLSDLTGGRIEYETGGQLQYEVKNDKPFKNWYDAQAVYNKALQDKYKDFPVSEILSNSIKDKNFKNTNLDSYSDSLVSKYGDKYLTKEEVDSISKTNNVPNAFELDSLMRNSDLEGANKSINTTGKKEDKLDKYGLRMMMERSFPEGKSPYKGYANGGNLEELSANWYVPIPTYGNGGNFDFMMANGGQAIQPRIDDVSGSNMNVPSTNNNIYTKGSSAYSERRGGIDIPNPDTSVINSGQTHSTSPIGGTPIGNRALVEDKEVIYKDKSGKKYVFSEKLKR